jgi:VanZ family protein
MFLNRFKYALLWAGFIAILCGIPGRDLPHISFLELLSFDKWVHAGLFFILQFLIYKEIEDKNSNSSLLIAWLLCILYGGSLELMQGAIFTDRSADIFDFIANSFGASLAMVFRVKLFNTYQLFTKA